MKVCLGYLEFRERRFDLGMLLSVFLLALATRLGYIALLWGTPETANEDPHYYSLIARHLIKGKGYLGIADRAYRPPAYPLLLAAIYSVPGVNQHGTQIVMAALGALSCVLVCLWVRQLSTRRVGYFAGLMTAIYPQFVRYPQTLYSETFYLFLLSLAMVLLLWSVRHRSVAGAALTGITFGLGALTREASLMMPVIAGIWLLMMGARRSHQALKLCLVMTAATILMVLSWTVRNYLVLGAFVPISTNSGINFYIGNNAQATGLPDWRLVPGVQWNDGANEVEAHRRGLQEGLRYVQQHPAQTVGMWIKKVWLLWRPPFYGYDNLSLPVKEMRFLWLMFYLVNGTLGVYGFLHVWRARPVMLLPLLIMICFSVPYILTFTDTRYRLPMESCAIFYAMIGLELLLRRRFGFDGPPLIDEGGFTHYTQAVQNHHGEKSPRSGALDLPREARMTQ